MPTLIHGSIGVTPIQLKTAATLEDMQEQARQAKPSPIDFSPGWGAISDSIDPLDTTGITLLAGSPAIIDGDEILPRRLEMRAYWWKMDTTVLRHVGTDREDEARRLTAVDIIISSDLHREDSYLVLVSTRNAKELAAEVKPMIEELLEPIDSSALVSLDSEDFDRVNNDFFLWLLHKALEENAISEDLEVLHLREAQAIDRSTRQSRLSKGVTADRPDMLALVASETFDFGPLKVVIDQNSIGLRLSCEVDFKGAYGIIKGGSAFREPPELELEEYENVLYALYYAHSVYPDLVTIWLTDHGWTEHVRDEFRRSYREQLRNALVDL